LKKEEGEGDDGDDEDDDEDDDEGGMEDIDWSGVVIRWEVLHISYIILINCKNSLTHIFVLFF
jgi:hypothetical protein